MSSRRRKGVNGEEDFGNQSLPVAQLPQDFDGIPLDGSMYLAMVRQEASLHPSFFQAKTNPYAAAQANAVYQAPISRADELGLPSLEWRAAFLARFESMRLALTNIPINPPDTTQVARLPKAKMNDAANRAWYRYVFGKERPTDENGEMIEVDYDAEMDGQGEQEDEEDSDGLVNGEPRQEPLRPTATILSRFTTAHLLSLLSAIPYWITIPTSGPSQEPSLVALNDFLSQWCFSLLAKLDARLISDEISILRTLARSCIAAISLRRTERGVGANDADQEAGAWMIITIIAGVWGQSDMWTDAEEEMTRLQAAS